jgi:hypothetical protein
LTSLRLRFVPRRQLALTRLSAHLASLSHQICDISRPPGVALPLARRPRRRNSPAIPACPRLGPAARRPPHPPSTSPRPCTRPRGIPALEHSPFSSLIPPDRQSLPPRSPPPRSYPLPSPEEAGSHAPASRRMPGFRSPSALLSSVPSRTSRLLPAPPRPLCAPTPHHPILKGKRHPPPLPVEIVLPPSKSDRPPRLEVMSIQRGETQPFPLAEYREPGGAFNPSCQGSTAQFGGCSQPPAKPDGLTGGSQQPPAKPDDFTGGCSQPPAKPDG